MAFVSIGLNSFSIAFVLIFTALTVSILYIYTVNNEFMVSIVKVSTSNQFNFSQITNDQYISRINDKTKPKSVNMSWNQENLTKKFEFCLFKPSSSK